MNRGFEATGPVSSFAGKGAPSRFLVFFGLMFLLPGLAISWFFGVRPILKVLEARDWEEAPARVLESEVRTHRGSDSTTYSIQISYTYEWGGQTFQSDRYDFWSGSSSGYQSKARVVRQYPRGHEFMAFVNPSNPSESVINREFRWAYAIIAGFSSLFVLVGGGVLALGLRERRKENGPVSGLYASGGGASIESPSDANNWMPLLDTPDARGKVTLKNRSSPIAAAIGLFIFALIWNGFLSVFLVNIWKSWQEGKAEIFMILFLTPFLLVGLAVIVFFFYTVLASFNPRVSLALATGNPRMGETVGLEWNLTGAVHRLRTFTIRLEGVERATTSSGNSSHTHENVFFRSDVVSIKGMRALSAGTGSIALPAQMMHSFDMVRNKVVWRLVVHGGIDFWPDLRGSFPFTALPASGRRS